jgi:hypothetical protein
MREKRRQLAHTDILTLPFDTAIHMSGICHVSTSQVRVGV